ncbi:MAG: methyltransferase [Nanoarchaeota archaeon]|nr:methyltransferase [Nanoarchaeota archaeon]
MVYGPREDSYLIQKVIVRFSRGKVLDMGTGSGILAAEAAETADEVLGVDVDGKAVKEAKKRYPDIDFKVSNLFSRLGRSKFDLIIFNPPYLPTTKEDFKDAALDGGRHGDSVLLKFFNSSHKHLRPKGNILFLASSLTRMDRIMKKLKKHGLHIEKLTDEKLPFETLTVYWVWR